MSSFKPSVLQPTKAIEVIKANDPSYSMISLNGSSSMQMNPLKYATDIVNAMMTNTSVTSLDLSNCALPTSTANDIAEMLKRNKTLQKLALEGNKINADGVEI